MGISNPITVMLSLPKDRLTHDCRLHNPVTLYSFLQKFWFFVVFSLNEHYKTGSQQLR
jgi:hypothetical protein